MNSRDYAAFLPPQRRAHAECLPTVQRWAWKGHVIRVARQQNAQAAIRLIVCHGAGGYSDALWPICAQISPRACDLSIPDLPLYGYTTTKAPERVRYEDWISCLRDYIRDTDDGRPVVLWGFSIGGLLAHEVACGMPSVKAVIATCLVDPRSLKSRYYIARWGLGVVGTPFLWLARRWPLADVKIPMRMVANMKRMSVMAELSSLCMRDPRGGGARVPLGFLASFLTYRHTFACSRSSVHAPRVILVHPGADRWTPPSLSRRTLARMCADHEVILLENCSHFPLEEPGLSQMVTIVEEVLASSSL